MTLATMRNNILRFVPGLHPDVVNSIIQDSYRQLTAMEWNILKLSRNIYTVPIYSTGSVSVAANGDVVGVGTSFDPSFVGRQMRVHYADAFFTIDSYTSPTEIHLEDWPGEIVPAGTRYSIFKHIYSVPSSIGVILDVIYQTTLPKKSQFYFNQIDPSRSTIGTPTSWAFAGYDSNNNPQIELYPVPPSTIPIRIYGKRKVLPLTDSTSPILREDLIENQALIQCYRLKATQDLEGGWADRLQEQIALYDSLLEVARDEDYTLETFPDKAKDTIFGSIHQMGDDYWVSHDVE